MVPVRTVLEGLIAPGCPRWAGGALWVSDRHDHRVLRIDVVRHVAVPVTFLAGDAPSGLGWLPDGRLLVVALDSRVVLRLEPNGALVRHADLSSVATGGLGDLQTAPDGVSYVTDRGVRFPGARGGRDGGRILRVDPDGAVSVAAEELEAPGGLALSPDGTTVVVAEAAAGRLTSYRIAADGSLGGRRTFAELEPVAGSRAAVPDGPCFAEDGSVWCVDRMGHRIVQIADGAAPVEMVPVADGAEPTACVLGGPDGRTLYVTIGPDAEVRRSTAGQVGRIVAVELPAAGAMGADPVDVMPPAVAAGR